MLIPRGKYSFEFYEKFLTLHGSTFDHKIKYSSINRAFVLPLPDGVHYSYVIALSTPFRMGMRMINYLCLKFKKEEFGQQDINLTEEMREKYADKFQDTEGDLLSRILKPLVGCPILIPSGFNSAKGDCAIKCSNKAQDGYLFPLSNAVLFIYKPVTYIEHKDISHMEVSRIQEFMNSTGRTFDITIVSKKDESFNLTGIDKDEFQSIMGYCQEKDIKVRNMDEGGQVLKLDSLGAAATGSKTGRRGAAAVADADMEDVEDEEFEEEDDESFKDDSDEQDLSEDDISLDQEEDAKPKKKTGKTSGSKKKPSKKKEESKEEE